jgi:inhibitor of cysteine peptidase
MRIIDQSQNNETVEVDVGTRFQVQLRENATTGYRWHLQALDDSIIHLVEDSVGGLQQGYGSGNVRQWTFEVARAASASLKIELRRGSEQPADVFGVTIRVRV